MPRISGRKEASDRLRRLSGQQKVELVGRALFSGGEAIKAEAQHLITSGTRTGTFEKQGVKRRNFVRSAPGEPPTYDTELLKSRIEVHQVAPLRVQVVSDAPYAVELEGGTSKMAARPYMGPAARNKKKEVIEGVNRAVAVATKRK